MVTSTQLMLLDTLQTNLKLLRVPSQHIHKFYPSLRPSPIFNPLHLLLKLIFNRTGNYSWIITKTKKGQKSSKFLRFNFKSPLATPSFQYSYYRPLQKEGNVFHATTCKNNYVQHTLSTSDTCTWHDTLILSETKALNI